MDLFFFYLIANSIFGFILIFIHETGHYIIGRYIGIPKENIKIQMRTFPPHVAIKKSEQFISPVDYGKYIDAYFEYDPEGRYSYRLLNAGFVAETTLILILFPLFIFLVELSTLAISLLFTSIMIDLIYLAMCIINTIRYNKPWGDWGGGMWLDEGVFNYRVAGIWIKKGYVLLHKNVNDNHWALPGGRVGIMEESNQALQRELQEELGVDVKVERFLWSSENFFNYNGKNYHEIGFYYLVTSITDYESNLNQEAFFGMEGKRLVYKWIPIAELNKFSLYPGFLKEGIRDLPGQSQHIVVRDVDSLNHRNQ